MKAVLTFALIGAFFIWCTRYAPGHTPPPGHDWSTAYTDMALVDALITGLICGGARRRPS